MQITIEQQTSWNRALNAARWTMGKDAVEKEPSEWFKVKSLMSVHSPKRMVEYDIKIKNIAYCNAVHFVRHHVGVEKFQCTLRDDRNEEIDDRRKLPQDYPVNLWIACNAESLLNISYVRLCQQSSLGTRMIWQKVRRELLKIDPIVARFMVPQCVRCGFCPEDPESCCGFVESDFFARQLQEYRTGFKQNNR